MSKIPLLLVLLGGAYLLSQASDEPEEEEAEGVPTSIDYSSPELKDALDQTQEAEDETT